MNYPMKLTGLGFAVIFALIAGGCPGPSQTTSALKPKLNHSARQIVGTSLIGAKGKTPADQEKIDDTVTGLCGAGTWTKSECARHDASK